jgi:hypothetical protein
VDVVWTADEFDGDELDFLTEEGAITISRVLGCRVLWNKADIVFEMRKPMSKPLQPPPSSRVAQVTTTTETMTMIMAAVATAMLVV